MDTIIGTGSSLIDSNNRTTCTVITNDSGGYKLDWKAATASMVNANSDTIAAYTPTTASTPETWSVGATDSEWGGHLGASSTTVNTTTWGSADTYDGGKWLNIATSDFQIASRSSETSSSGDNEVIFFGGQIGANKFQPTGTYTNTVTLTATSLSGGSTPITDIGAITGTPQVGSVLTAGGLTPSGATATYQWQSAATTGGTYTPISGATSSTYTPVTGDLGRFIKVEATGTYSYTGTQTSAATTEIEADGPPANLWVAVGNATVGENSIITSSDGITWVGRGDPFDDDNGIGYDVAYNGSRWVAVGTGGTNSIVWLSLIHI